MIQLGRLRQDEFKPSMGYKVGHTSTLCQRFQLKTPVTNALFEHERSTADALSKEHGGRLTSTRSQKNTLPSSEQLTTCVSRSLRQQSSLYFWFLWPTYLAVGVDRIRGARSTPEVG